MATPGRPIDEPTRRRIERLRDCGRSIRETARLAGVCVRTVQKYGGNASGAGVAIEADPPGNCATERR